MLVVKIESFGPCRWHDCEDQSAVAVESSGQQITDQRFRMVFCQKHADLIRRSPHRPMRTVHGDYAVPPGAMFNQLPPNPPRTAERFTVMQNPPKGVTTNELDGTFQVTLPSGDTHPVEFHDWIVIDSEDSTRANVCKDAHFRKTYVEFKKEAAA